MNSNHADNESDEDSGNYKEDRRVSFFDPKELEELKRRDAALLYGVDETPSVPETVIYGLQQMLMSVGSSISAPLLVCGFICIGNSTTAKSEIISSFLFMCGITTIIQSLFGVRLPIFQGGSHTFVAPAATLMTLEHLRCPEPSLSLGWYNLTDSSDNNTDYVQDEIWKERMRELQGGLILASLTQVIIGATGMVGVILNYIGPLTIAPTIALIGLSLWEVILNLCQTHWGISGATTLLLLVFSLYMANLDLPFPIFDITQKKCRISRFPVFKVLPVLLAMILGWILSIILTATNVIPNDPSHKAYFARSDARIDTLYKSKWFFWPYPGQWGAPIFSVPSFISMLGATISSIIESVGDYYACAKMCHVLAPPTHALNRGIAMEGIGSVLSGLFGTGGASTSYSGNIGAIGFTHVASRLVFIVAGGCFILAGVIGKFGALAAMMPDPVLGAVLLVALGMVLSVAISSLSAANMESSRNRTIFGFSILIGFILPAWIRDNPNGIKTGSESFDQILMILLGTPMLLGGVVGFILDNTVPGSDEERGILEMKAVVVGRHADHDKCNSYISRRYRTYDLPFITPWLKRHSWSKYLPFSPTYKPGELWGKCRCSTCCKKDRSRNVNNVL